MQCTCHRRRAGSLIHIVFDDILVCSNLLQVSDLYDPRTQWASYIINAIKAKELFVKDVNYIVKKGEVWTVAVVTMLLAIARRGGSMC